MSSIPSFLACCPQTQSPFTNPSFPMSSFSHSTVLAETGFFFREVMHPPDTHASFHIFAGGRPVSCRNLCRALLGLPCISGRGHPKNTLHVLGGWVPLQPYCFRYPAPVLFLIFVSRALHCCYSGLVQLLGGAVVLPSSAAPIFHLLQCRGYSTNFTNTTSILCLPLSMRSVTLPTASSRLLASFP